MRRGRNAAQAGSGRLAFVLGADRLYGKPMRSTCFALWVLVFALWTAGCDPTLTFEAKAGCGEATAEESAEGPEMLPGRECNSCHRGFTAAGTIFNTLAASCNSGVAGATVEILDMDGNTAFTLTTNAVGSFYTKRKLPAPYTARVIGPDGQMQLGHTVDPQDPDTKPISDGNCSRCHRIPPVEKATGRLALTLSDSAGPDSIGEDAAAGSGD